jgi:hypothetical protein
MANHDDDREQDEYPNLVEVYRTNRDMEANRILVEVLEPARVDGFRRDRVVHALPAPDAEVGGYFIAVYAQDAERARDLIRQALEDEVLDPEGGEFLGEKN